MVGARVEVLPQTLCNGIGRAMRDDRIGARDELGEARCFEPVPQVLLNVAVSRKRPLEELEGVQRALSDVERSLGADGRVFVRYSGTENKARVLVEGPDAAAIRAHADRIAEELRRALA